MSSKDGGPAFVARDNNPDLQHLPVVVGISLRDWFAGQALAGMSTDTMSDAERQSVARCAYALADALIAERSKS